MTAKMTRRRRGVSTGLALAGLLSLAMPVVQAASQAPASAQPTTLTFKYTGAPQYFTVPPGVTEILINASGAQGGWSCAAAGGNGGETEVTIPVTSGLRFQVDVGGMGGPTNLVPPFNGSGGWNGGGGGGVGGGYYGAGGGGASDVRQLASGETTAPLADRRAVAGGGGGAGNSCPIFASYIGAGGSGGGLAGAAGKDGTDPSSVVQADGGGGGTQDHGGAGGYANFPDSFSNLGNPGALGSGGPGGSANSPYYGGGGSGGGGGGGYYGGGGGAACIQFDYCHAAGGGGGSGYPSTASFSSAGQDGNGLVVISYLEPSAPDAPTIGHAIPGDAAARVTFTPPADDGGMPVTSYTVTATDQTDLHHGGQTATGPGSPLTVTGLSNGDTYTFTVTATNTLGNGPPSAASSPVTPNPLVYIANQGSNSVTEYASGADGNAYPFTTVQGDHTGIDHPTAVALAAAGDVWVASQGSNSVTEYAGGADGNASPIATIQGDLTKIDHPRGLAVTPDGALWVVNSNNSLTEYASGAGGNASPVATVQGGHTGLDGAYGVAVTADGNLWVANSGSNSLTDYASGADGNASPIATIQGDRTGLREPINVALDGAGDVFVTNAATTRGVPSVTEYASGADGNALPIATISGSAADLHQPVGLAVDRAGHIFVSEPGGLVKEFVKGAMGDTPPIATIIGDHTGLNEPISVAVADAAP